MLQGHMTIFNQSECDISTQLKWPCWYSQITNQNLVMFHAQYSTDHLLTVSSKSTHLEVNTHHHLLIDSCTYIETLTMVGFKLQTSFIGSDLCATVKKLAHSRPLFSLSPFRLLCMFWIKNSEDWIRTADCHCPIIVVIDLPNLCPFRRYLFERNRWRWRETS